MTEYFDHCTSCHETFPQEDIIMHESGADECPKCHRENHTCGLFDGWECPTCGANEENPDGNGW